MCCINSILLLTRSLLRITMLLISTASRPLMSTDGSTKFEWLPQLGCCLSNSSCNDHNRSCPPISNRPYQQIVDRKSWFHLCFPHNILYYCISHWEKFVVSILWRIRDEETKLASPCISTKYYKIAPNLVGQKLWVPIDEASWTTSINKN